MNNVFAMDENIFRLTCSRCGTYEYIYRMTYYKRVERGDPNITDCQDCEYRQGRKTDNRRKIRCNPHKGELDDNLRPLDKRFKLYRPGKRICGNSDCIKREHILEGE